MPEQIKCPQCERALRVPENLLGKKVKCPTCAATFTATIASETPPRAESPAQEEETFQVAGEPAPPAKGEDAAPTQRRRRSESVDDDEEENEPEEEEYDERPRRRRKRGRQAPHRGTLILVLGILSLVVCGLLGPVAWIMGNADLNEMRLGRMDAEGKGVTNAGRICGMISTILILIGCGCYALVFLASLASGPAFRR
jgi:predicted Zn finger-like uncharacterized protein